MDGADRPMFTAALAANLDLEPAVSRLRLHPLQFMLLKCLA